MMGAVTDFVHDERGNAASEMALMLPLLTVMLFGGIEFGHFFWTEHQVIKSVRDGARFAGRHKLDLFDCDTGNVSDATLEAEIQKLTRTGFLDGDNPDASGADNPVVRNWSDDDTVTVSVQCIGGASYSGKGIYEQLAQPVIDEETGEEVVDEVTGEVVTEGPSKKVIVSAEVDYPSLFGGFAFLSFLDGYELKASAESPVMGF